MFSLALKAVWLYRQRNLRSIYYIYIFLGKRYRPAEFAWSQECDLNCNQEFDCTRNQDACVAALDLLFSFRFRFRSTNHWANAFAAILTILLSSWSEVVAADYTLCIWMDVSLSLIDAYFSSYSYSKAFSRAWLVPIKNINTLWGLPRLLQSVACILHRINIPLIQ